MCFLSWSSSTNSFTNHSIVGGCSLVLSLSLSLSLLFFSLSLPFSCWLPLSLHLSLARSVCLHLSLSLALPLPPSLHRCLLRQAQKFPRSQGLFLTSAFSKKVLTFFRGIPSTSSLKDPSQTSCFKETLSKKSNVAFGRNPCCQRVLKAMMPWHVGHSWHY